MRPGLIVRLGVVALVLLTGACTGTPTADPAPSASPTETVVPPDAVLRGAGFDRTPLPGGTPLPASAILAGKNWELMVGPVLVTRVLPTDVVQGLFASEALTGDRVFDRELPVRAAPGHELVVTRLGQLSPYGRYQSDARPGPFEVVVAGNRRRVGISPHETGTLVVVSVPVGADAVLQVRDHGRTGGLSLRTGAGPGLGACRRPVETRGAGSYVLRYRGLSWSATVDVLAWETSWAEGLGWAPTGRCWLTAVPYVSYQGFSTRPGVPRHSWDFRQPTELTGIGPRIVTAVADGRRLPAGRTTWDVAAGATRTLALTIAPTGPRAIDGSAPVTWSTKAGPAVPTGVTLALR